MENYERLIIELLEDGLTPGLTPRAKYEYLKFLLSIHKLYKATKESLERDLEYFGQDNKRHIQARRTYNILTGVEEFIEDDKLGEMNHLKEQEQ